ncbi:hypothetical protein ID866_8687 [Astraeus odoratus]|nr:hypothetical protein ID866_8687 [Astraeus odoratus]
MPTGMIQLSLSLMHLIHKVHSPGSCLPGLLNQPAAAFWPLQQWLLLVSPHINLPWSIHTPHFLSSSLCFPLMSCLLLLVFFCLFCLALLFSLFSLLLHFLCLPYLSIMHHA